MIRRLFVVAAAAIVSASTVGCGLGSALVASPVDHDDYVAIRMAAHEGTRIAREKAYLERHPKGVYAAEVRAAYEVEEPAYFERAKATPEGARDYLASLPDGPHAGPASAALRGVYERADDIALDRELREGRVAEVRFQRARKARAAASQAFLDALAALSAPGVLGASFDAPPPSLLRAAHGELGSLAGLPTRAERDAFFALPAPKGSHDADRVLSYRVELRELHHRVVRLEIAGPDLLVRFREAESSTALDASSPADRKVATAHALEVIAGALEARFPRASCEVTPRNGEILARACHGERVSVVSPEAFGADDRLVLEPAGDAHVASPKGNE